MRVGGIYSFNNGKEIIEANYAAELHEIQGIIEAVDGSRHKTKVSAEKTMPGKMLYKPSSLNRAFSREFEKRSWEKYKVLCEYPQEFYTSDYNPSVPLRGAYGK